MIICAEKGFAFIHIPKNGGSTVQNQILPFDDLDGRFQTRSELDGFGRVHLSHLPLEYIEKAFPDEFAKLQQLDVYAVVRDPADRFVSALSQRVRERRRKTLPELEPRAVDEEIAIIRDHIAEHPHYPEFEFVHFIPQTAFIFLRGEQLVRHLYPIERMPALLQDLSQRLGVRLIEDFHSNKTVTFKNPEHRKRLVKVKNRAKSVLPNWAYFPLKELGLKVFTEPGGGESASHARERFLADAALRDFYAEDDKLYRETLAGAERHELGGIA